MGWRLPIDQTIWCVGVIMNKALINWYGHQHIDYVILFILGYFPVRIYIKTLYCNGDSL